MGVVTAADEELIEARQEIESIIRRLSRIVINRCWGWDKFNPEYQGRLRENLNILLDMRDKL